MDIEQARRVLIMEADAVRALADRIGDEFLRAAKIVVECPGKVALTGMGKSGLVARKIASTLASTGTPSFFLHPAEAIHGDIGMLSKDDVVVALSKSGETKEIIALLPTFKRMGLKLIAITGATGSTLGKAADVNLDASVKEEACPLNLAPTSSAIAALAMGDALAITALKSRGFSETDFAALHPGGALGRRLLRVKDLMRTGAEIPSVRPDETAENALLEISAKRIGHAAVVSDKGGLAGVITDGDVRRAISKFGSLKGKAASDIMSGKPKTIESDELAAKALQIMETHKITALFIVDPDGMPTGVIHLHDILKANVA